MNNSKFTKEEEKEKNKTGVWVGCEKVGIRKLGRGNKEEMENGRNCPSPSPRPYYTDDQSFQTSMDMEVHRQMAPPLNSSLESLGSK